MNVPIAALLTRGALAANGVRIALTVACIALGVALAGAVHTVHTSALAEIDRAARTLAGAADLEIRGPRSGFDDALFAPIARRPEVAAAQPIVEVSAARSDGGDAVRVLGIDAFRAVRLQPAFVLRASSTGAGESGRLLDPDAVWLSPAAATRLRLRAGGKLRLVAGSAPRDFEVAGVLDGLSSAGEVAVMDISAAQLAFDRVGSLSRIELRLKPGTDERGLREQIAPLLPAGVVVSPAASLSGRAASISHAYRVNLDALALVALATGAFLVFSTLALQAARRRQEFALLRALGVTRRELAALLAAEGALLGAIGAAIGTAIGLAASQALLGRFGGDLGAGFFGEHGAAIEPDPLGLAGIALLGIGMSVGGALWVARAVGRIDVAQALYDRAIDLPQISAAGLGLAALLALAGTALLFVPPIGGLPLGGYAAIALWLAASVVAVVPLCRAMLGAIRQARSPVAALALAQLRHLPGHLAASVAGIVVSASLCMAMAIMVYSFRVSFEEWLQGVVGADLYADAAGGGDSGFFTLDQQRRVAGLPEVARMEPLRYDRLAIAGHPEPFSIVARPIDARVLAGFQAEPRGMPGPGGAVPIWISEAARELHGWKVGDEVELPIAGRAVRAQVAGLIRDYARTWGAALFPYEEYRKLTGDSRAHDLAIRLAPGVDVARAQEAIRRALPEAGALAFEDAAQLRRKSMAIFDRSFAITYALEAIAIAIGIAGLTSSFAALAWSRRREFGVLRFLGLTRREILRMLTIEGAAAGALGTAIGLASGAAISLVLVHVVSRQSFHWGMEVHWPLPALLALIAGIVAMCAFGARASAALAVRHEAVLAVKDDA